MSDEHDDLAGLRAEIDGVGRTAAKRFDPGAGALTIAIAALAVLISLVLPWTEDRQGFSILFGDAQALPKFFSWAAVLTGVLLPAVTLATRRWTLAWVCALTSFATSIAGVLSIWTTQTTTSHTPGPGPGFGLIVAAIAAVILLIKWLRIAASRPPLP